jgi:predicted nucleic acid-binding protein
VTLALVDSSVWGRRTQTLVGAALVGAIENDEIGVIDPIVMELLRSARDAGDFAGLSSQYDALHQIELTPEMNARARAIQRALSRRGYHRGPSVTDLLAAAAAEAAGAELWHCDRHFELIAEVTGQPLRRLGT